jgi:ribonuclease R
MNTDKDCEAIVKLIQTDAEKTWRPSDICQALDFRGKQVKHLNGLLREMVRDGMIAELRPGTYGLGKAAGLATGRLRMMRSGAAVVSEAASEREIWVSSDDTSTALPGDTVTVRLDPGVTSARGEPCGKVIRIVERSPREIVGTLRTTGKFLCVVPLDPVYRHSFYVPDAKGAKEADRVVVNFTNWANRHVAPEGEIVDVIGPADKPSLDTEVIMRQYDLHSEFPEEVVREAESVAARMQRPGKREDLRDSYIVTIDPIKARDFDDAISMTLDEQGRRVLGVHIADVCHFVRPGGALDKEARERGTSVYLVDKVIPMLPEQLSNGVCSLRPNEDRLTFSAFMTFDASGRMIARRFAKTRIHSRQRLSYEQAMTIMSDRVPEGMTEIPEQTKVLLADVRALARQLRARRFADAALDIDVPECEVVIGPDGRMTGIRTVPHDESHQLIEECMVAANEAVAAELASRGVRIIARLHEAPDPDKLEELRTNLATLGIKSGFLGDPERLARFLAEVSTHPLHQQAHTMVLRSMKRALYSSEASGHFGLAKKHYAHFTSPIRRYPDLVLHRQLAGMLEGAEGGNGILPADYLKRTAALATEREQLADDASRALIEIKKFRFLQQQLEDHKPLDYDAVVTRVTNFGMFVDVVDLQMSGMIHISNISPNFVRYNSANESLNSENETFRLGTPVRVRVVRVDFDQRRADFTLVREKEPVGAGYRQPPTGNRDDASRLRYQIARRPEAAQSSEKPFKFKNKNSRSGGSGGNNRPAKFSALKSGKNKGRRNRQ